MAEFEKRKDKSVSENAKALKHIFKSKMKSMKEEKWKKKLLHSQYPRILKKSHLDTVTTNINGYQVICKEKQMGYFSQLRTK